MSSSSDTMFKDIYGNVLEPGDKVLIAKGGVMCEAIILYYTNSSMCISWYSHRLDKEYLKMVKDRADYNIRYEHLRNQRAFCKYHNSKIYLKSACKQYFDRIFYLLDKNISNVPEHLRRLIKKNE